MDASRLESKVEDSAANSTPNKQNAGLCQLLTAPVPMALAAKAIVTAEPGVEPEDTELGGC